MLRQFSHQVCHFAHFISVQIFMAQVLRRNLIPKSWITTYQVLCKAINCLAILWQLTLRHHCVSCILGSLFQLQWDITVLVILQWLLLGHHGSIDKLMLKCDRFTIAGHTSHISTIKTVFLSWSGQFWVHLGCPATIIKCNTIQCTYLTVSQNLHKKSRCSEINCHTLNIK